MGRQTNIKIRGTQGNIIYYKWKEVFSMRAKPVRVKQTKATKACASVFGKASVLGAALRKAFESLLPNAKDKNMQLNFLKALQALLLQYKTGTVATAAVTPKLTGFLFNEKAGCSVLQKLISIVAVDSNGVQAAMAAFNPVQMLHPPKAVQSVTVLLAAASCNPVKGTITDQNLIQQEIAYTDTVVDTKQLLLPLQPEKGDFIMIAAAMQFNKIENNLPQPVKQLRYQPAMVLGVWVME